MANRTTNPFGSKHTTLRPVIIDTASNKPEFLPKTRTILISDPLYRFSVAHSKRYYNTEIYETILEDLLKCYAEHNTPDYRYNHLSS